ncbi:response regulator transcription factor [Amnibacterium kyonggiense]|uniref:Two-component system response regulator QseB n=1 Tax=Amnibacterium kyonggiense TaxID=595671 RepID=A0A4R7FSD5_9MICO|nr:response regulator transcription factor [Amnibacterium kyonggiense]TDS80772.1 two-component system response regulator QseB [Amnibacterium kyonggiense]
MSERATALPPLLLIEDDPRIGPMTVAMLANDYAVELAIDAATGFRLATGRDFAAIVLDRRLPDGDGLDLVRTLRADGRGVPIILLTALGSLDDRVGGLDAGADDYLVKPFAAPELLARLRAITREHSDRDAAIMIGDWEFRPTTRIINSPYSGRIVLSRTEAELLHLLARHPDQTLSRERILRSVFSPGDAVGTVDTYVHHLRKKTDRDIVTTVRGQGYRVGNP